MKPTQNINPGDRVIAKMRGCNYWPARVLKMKGTSRKRKYEVQFFCTFDTAVVQEGSVIHFNGETKKKLRYNGNQKDMKKYLDVAIEEIEKDICMPPPTKISRTSLSDSLGLESSPGAASSGGALSLGKGSESAATSDQPRRPKCSGRVSPDIIDAPYQYLHSWMSVAKSPKSQTGLTKAGFSNARSSLSSVTLSVSSSPGLENFKNMDLNAECGYTTPAPGEFCNETGAESLVPPPAPSVVNKVGDLGETELNTRSFATPLVQNSTISTVKPVARCSGSSMQDELEADTAMGTDDQFSETAECITLGSSEDDEYDGDNEDEDYDEENDLDYSASDSEDEDTRMVNKFCINHSIPAKWEDEDPVKAWRTTLSTMSSPLDWFTEVHTDAMAKPLPFKLDCEEGTPLYKANKLLMENQYGIDFDLTNEWLATHGSKHGDSAPGGEAGPSTSNF